MWECKKCGMCCNTKYITDLTDFREVKENGDCVYLENGLCSIYEDRPYQCQIYPYYWVSNYDLVKKEVLRYKRKKLCPREEKGD